jgi:hypothetical protein
MKLFSDSGDVSYGRVGSFIALMFGIMWVSFVVYKKEAIPDLGGITAFVAALYALGKVNETVQKFTGGGNA